MHRPAPSRLAPDPIPLERFLELQRDDLGNILAELESSRAKRESPLNPDAIEALIRVMDRHDYQTVSLLGPEAARAWARRVGIV